MKVNSICSKCESSIGSASPHSLDCLKGAGLMNSVLMASLYLSIGLCFFALSIIGLAFSLTLEACIGSLVFMGGGAIFIYFFYQRFKFRQAPTDKTTYFFLAISTFSWKLLIASSILSWLWLPDNMAMPFSFSVCGITLSLMLLDSYLIQKASGIK